MTSQEEALRLQDITKVYPNGVMANDSVNLSVFKGEIHALSGENGAGKTTLMKILFGEESATDGDIFIRGEKVKITSPTQAIKMGIGLVHQHFRHGRRPIDVGVAQQAVVARQGREIVTPGVSVALRILRGGAVDIHHAVARPDAVVADVCCLALGETLCEVPQQAVVVWRRRELRELRC